MAVQVRNLLEKATAHFMATGVRPSLWISQDFYRDPINSSPSVRATVYEKSRLDYERVDSIEHYGRILELLNENVEVLQQGFMHQVQKHNIRESIRLRNKLESRTGIVLEYLTERTTRGIGYFRSLLDGTASKGDSSRERGGRSMSSPSAHMQEEDSEHHNTCL